MLPGNVIHELVHNDRVIGGMDEASTRKAMEFYGQFVKGTLHPTNSKTAEMCKLTENSSRDVQSLSPMSCRLSAIKRELMCGS